MTRILIIDDNKAVLNFLKIFLMQTGKFETYTLEDSSKAYDLLKKEKFDLLLLDMDMPEITGMDILRFIKEEHVDIVTIVLTGVEDIDMAINAMKLGTFDYLLKPIDEEKILHVIESAIKDHRLKRVSYDDGREMALSDIRNKKAFDTIITQDKEMFKIFHQVEKYAQTNNSVLIWGESGTGKELIANAIRNISERKKNKFVAVNAGVFATELFASEFFGHTKGSFTGAVSDKKGLIEEAHGGTLFLDEIGELSLPIQVKLLRFLQEEEFYKIGSTKNIKVDVRIIAATNKNLFEEIKNGSFRKDLFFRLNINSINLPPLRQRKGDIQLLAYHFLKLYNKKYNKNINTIAEPAMNFLKSYPFSGNIRELMNIINSAIIIENTHELRRKSLPYYLLENNQAMGGLDKEFQPKSLQEIEKEHIRKVLEYTGQNRSKASEILGISRVSLITRIRKYGLG
jgi:DNA-binding NtrC family response regulator